MRLGLGCVALGSGAGRQVADDVRLVRAAIDLGFTVFDTSDAYGAGASEHVLGLAVRGRRDDVMLATKGGFAFRARNPAEQWARRWSKSFLERVRSGRATQPAAPAHSAAYDRQDFSPRHLREAVHASLRRMRTDHIDVYQLHGPPEVLPGLLDQLSDLVVVGDVGRFGVGASSVDSADAWTGLRGVSLIQVPFGMLDPEAASTMLPLARERATEVWVRGVFGGGVLSLAEREPDALALHPKAELVQTLRRIADSAGLDQYELALGYVRAHADYVSTVLVGSTSVAHLRRNTALLAGPDLEDEVVLAVSDAIHSWAAREHA